jgi:cell division transport system permease protein
MRNDRKDTAMANGRVTKGTRPILPHADRTGPTAWVVAVMTFLAMIGVAAAVALTPAAAQLSGQIAGRATIQIVDGDPISRRAAVQAIRRAIEDAPYVRRVETVSEADLEGMASQWLGDGVRTAGIALPALIDVDLVGTNGTARLRDAVAAVAPSARVIPHADWLGPVARLMRSVGWLALALALLLILSAAAIATLAARAALSAQRATIDVLHLVGATDVQIARLFQAHIARDTMIGAGVGAVLALAVLALLAWQVIGIQSGIAGPGNPFLYLWTLLVPMLVIAAAITAARWSVLRALRAMP